MQIKKAAELSGLTERAVRLYEERGLITPEHINKNGRDFREYSDADVEKLKTIASLRRALFTIEEIKEMEDYPSMIPEIVNSHRDRMHIDFENLSYLVNHIDRVDETSVTSTEELAAAIFAPPKLSERATDPTEEEKILFSEQYEKIYEKYFAENTGWEKRYDASLAIENFWQKMWNRKFRVLTVSVLAVFIVFIFLNGYVRNETVELTLNGVKFDESTPENQIPVKATVTGTIKRYIFKDDTAYLQVWVDGYDFYYYGRGPHKESKDSPASFDFIAILYDGISTAIAEPLYYGSGVDFIKNPNGYRCNISVHARFENGNITDIVLKETANEESVPGSFSWDVKAERTLCFSVNGTDSAIKFYKTIPY